MLSCQKELLLKMEKLSRIVKVLGQLSHSYHPFFNEYKTAIFLYLLYEREYFRRCIHCHDGEEYSEYLLKIEQDYGISTHSSLNVDQNTYKVMTSMLREINKFIARLGCIADWESANTVYVVCYFNNLINCRRLQVYDIYTGERIINTLETQTSGWMNCYKSIEEGELKNGVAVYSRNIHPSKWVSRKRYWDGMYRTMDFRIITMTLQRILFKQKSVFIYEKKRIKLFDIDVDFKAALAKYDLGLNTNKLGDKELLNYTISIELAGALNDYMELDKGSWIGKLLLFRYAYGNRKNGLSIEDKQNIQKFMKMNSGQIIPINGLDYMFMKSYRFGKMGLKEYGASLC